MPMPSPKYRSGGSLKKLATDSYGISVTLVAFALLWARSGAAPKSNTTKSDERTRFMRGLRKRVQNRTDIRACNQGNLYPRAGLFNTTNRFGHNRGVIGGGRPVRQDQHVFEPRPGVVATPRHVINHAPGAGIAAVEQPRHLDPCPVEDRHHLVGRFERSRRIG